MMQQIRVNGPLHFPEDCVLLADKIYPNRHPTVTLFTTQQINRKPEHMRDSSIFIRLLGLCIGILGTYFFSCRFSKFLMNWAHAFFTQTL